MRVTLTDDFENALLGLDTALRPLVDRGHLTERTTAVKEAHQAFLAAVAPFRLKVMIAESNVMLKSVDDALALLAKAIDIARTSGASPSDIAALFNRKVGGGAE